MATHTVCPRCGARDSFIKGYLPETCVCRVCQSQLGWSEIPGCGPDCQAASAAGGPPAGGATHDGAAPLAGADSGADSGDDSACDPQAPRPGA
jgi:hypothetical protein